MVIEGKLSSGHARAIISIEDKEKQYMVAQKIFDENSMCEMLKTC